MPQEDELKSQIKRLDYWSRDETSQPPKRIVKPPEDITLEDLMLTKFGDYLNTIRTEYHD